MTAALDAARDGLGDAPAWVVGGAVRDRMLGRAVSDVDLVASGDVKRLARELALGVGGAVFPLGEAFGAWRVLAADRSWHVDISPLHQDSLLADLARRDFTVNAMAEPLRGGELVDPHGGAEDLAARRLRAVSERSLPDDPLRVLRLPRLACELGLEAEPQTLAAARAAATGLAGVAAERVFTELKRILSARAALDGLELADAAGALDVVLPEIAAMHGVQQNRFHHLDVFDHTLATLQVTIDLQADPGAVLGEAALAEPVRAALAAPFGDELTRGAALRVGALLHDVAKPHTQRREPDGTVLGFPGHAEQGAEMTREILTRLRSSERLRAHAAALARHHLRAGFLTHEPLTRRAVFGYLTSTAPVALDVTLLTVADRMATRGRNAQEAIDRHLAVARPLIAAALEQEAAPPQTALVRGDELAAALGVRPGPELGRLLAEIAAARYAGEISTREEAIALADRLR